MRRPTPTRWTPGTRQKVEVMRLRASSEQDIFSPDDATTEFGFFGDATKEPGVVGTLLERFTKCVDKQEHRTLPVLG